MKNPDRLQSLQDKIYSRDGDKLQAMREHELREKAFSVKSDFDDLPQESLPVFEAPQKPHRFLGKIFVMAFVFFILTGSYAGYMFLKGENSVSSKNIDIGISGPVSSPGGEALSLDVSVVNRNKTNLRLAELIIEYPAGTRRADNTAVELTTERLSLGNIESGKTIRKSIRAVLFGEEKSVADIKFSLEYRIPNSNAIFTKEVPYDVIISSNPLSLLVDAPKEAVSGQDMTLKLTVRSNTTEVIKNVLVSAQYPAGFSFKSSTPPVGLNTALWKLGDLAPGDTRVITITGKLQGENEDTRVFRFSSGLGNGSDATAIATPFAGFKQEVAIKKPFIGLSILINESKASEVVAKGNQAIRVKVSYVNNLPVPVRDATITLNLAGGALDKSGVQVDQGFYQSMTNSVTWDKNTFAALGEVTPGEGGEVTLSITPRQQILDNPQILISGNVTGTRTESGKVPEQVIASISRVIKIESGIALSSRTSHYSGALSNTGPMPPKAEKETTYTITWSTTPGLNDVSDSVVKATLPSYVRYGGEISPASEGVSFNSTTREVAWDLGTIRAGSILNSPRSVSFKVEITPSVSQVGSSPVLVNEAKFIGNDRFTGTTLTAVANEVTIRGDDLQTRSGEDVVVR